MASCTTSKWGSKGTSPQIKLTVTLDSAASDGDTAVLDWKLQYIAEYAVSSSVSKSYTVKINGSSVKTGTYSIGGKTGTKTIASGSTNITKGTSAKDISFGCSMDIEITWNDVYKGTISASGSISIPAKTSYAIKYNANGGSGAPSSQTKWYGTTLTLSSTKPTRTGYTFAGWGTSDSDTSVDYKAGASYTANKAVTLYAIWTEHKLTINYYSNYATSAFDGALNAVGSGKNVLVKTDAFYYNNDYSNYGLADYHSSGGSAYMTRTGYTATGKWGTSASGGTLIDEDTGFASGQAIAKAVGKDLSKGNASINLYAQWTENKLTVNYYSNYATYAAYKGEEISVSASKNVLVYSGAFYYDTSYSSGLANVQNTKYIYLLRTGCAPTGYWGTTTSGGTLVNQNTSFATGQALAETLGKSLKNGNASVDVYAQWQENAYVLTYDSNGGSGEMNPQTIEWGELFNLSNNIFKRTGYKFIGWNAYRNSDGAWYVLNQGWVTEDKIVDGNQKKLYANQHELTFDTSWVKGNEEARLYTMYAIWEMSGGIVYIDNGITFEPYLPYIDNGTNWDVYLVYVDDGTNWNMMS